MYKMGKEVKYKHKKGMMSGFKFRRLNRANPHLVGRKCLVCIFYQKKGKHLKYLIFKQSARKNIIREAFKIDIYFCFTKVYYQVKAEGPCHIRNISRCKLCKNPSQWWPPLLLSPSLSLTLVSCSFKIVQARNKIKNVYNIYFQITGRRKTQPVIRQESIFTYRHLVDTWSVDVTMLHPHLHFL